MRSVLIAVLDPDGDLGMRMTQRIDNKKCFILRYNALQYHLGTVNHSEIAIQ